MLKPYDSKIRRFREWDVEIHIGEYPNGRPALVLLAADTPANWAQDVAPGEPIATASVNIPEARIPPGYILVKSWSENEGMAAWLEQNELAFNRTEIFKPISAGHCLADVMQLATRTSE